MKEATIQDIENCINGSGNYLLKFTAKWCSPCKSIQSFLDELEKEFANRIQFLSIDIEQNNEITTRFNITNVPTIIIFNNGVQKSCILGVKKKEVLRDIITKSLE
jgi:thioredoxin 1